MTAATRTIQATPGKGRFVGALAVAFAAMALLAVLATGQLNVSTSATAPLAGSAPAAHDHGWSSASSASAPATFDRGWATAPAANSNANANDAGRHHSSAASKALIIRGRTGGGINYTGIPYPAPGLDGTGGSNGTRFSK